MDTNYSDNNHLILVGKVTSEKRFSHEIYGEKFYIFDMEVPRLSDTTDIIPITASERIINDELIAIGNKLIIKGQFRSYNSYENERNKLILTVFAKDVILAEDENLSEEEKEETQRTSNEVTLVGYICKKPIYRQTPFGREIADILLAVNRAYNKSDYIPSIAWGRNARFSQNLPTGTEVKIIGRVQSRNYEKKHEDGTIENRVAYEVSISSLEVIKILIILPTSPLHSLPTTIIIPSTLLSIMTGLISQSLHISSLRLSNSYKDKLTHFLTSILPISVLLNIISSLLVAKNLIPL